MSCRWFCDVICTTSAFAAGDMTTISYFHAVQVEVDILLHLYICVFFLGLSHYRNLVDFTPVVRADYYKIVIGNKIPCLTLK